MKLTTNFFLTVFAVMALGLAALFPAGLVVMQMLAPRDSQASANPQATLDAIVQQTMIALTQTAPTKTPIPPTATPLPATPTPVPTSTFVPTSTPLSYCDWAAFVKDVTIPDGTTLQPGETFVKTWRVKNRGTCAWTSDYLLVFTNGSLMSAPAAVRLPAYVAPGQTIDLSVTFTAPTAPGHYVSYWMLRNPSGVLFGSGDNANKPIFADINVAKPSPSYGTVTGPLSYRNEPLPVVTLFFQNTVTGEIIQSTLAAGSTEYSVVLPFGTYYVYAWAFGLNLEGAYVNADGFLKPFTVYGGQTTSGVVITDWQPEHHQPAR
ncbi:MAG: NBR1-Ig-like domain-containing protein [Chloroflexota bacterium]